MKKIAPSIVFLLFCTPFFLTGQRANWLEPTKSTHLIVGIGVGGQWFPDPYKVGSVFLESPVAEYLNFGFRVSQVFQTSMLWDNFYYYGQSDLVEKKSFEIGFYGKYFLHGRFTGRKSGLFFGPDIRFGKLTYYDTYTRLNYTDGVRKIAINWGFQWQLSKHAVFALEAPMGIETIKHPDPALGQPSYYSTGFSESSFCITPSLMFGLAF